MTDATETIEVEILGDAAPFSELGRSITYRILAGEQHYLIDCGAPVFKYLGQDGVRRIKGIIGTHSHDDHKRWFTDIALFRYYAAGGKQTRLLTWEPIHAEYEQSARPALERTLSDDSKKVVQQPYLTFIEPHLIGPRARYIIIARGQTLGTDQPDWVVADRDGNVLPPSAAKVVVHPEAMDSQPRMLFKDETTGRWVEPDSFYPFTCSKFYEEDQNLYTDDEARLVFTAVKATAWHGPPTISVLVSRGEQKLFFTSDTAFSRDLWEKLASETHEQNLGEMTQEAFDQAHCIVGDINDYIEQTWSSQRLDRALQLYRECVIIHDVAGRNSVVHTDYANIAGEGLPRVLLTHAPDYFISQFPMAAYRKTLRIRGTEVFELQADGREYPLEGDIFVRDKKRYFVGFANQHGRFLVIQKEGILDVIPVHESTAYRVVLAVDLYEDINGRYLPVLEDENQRYMVRPDGEVEKVTYSESGSMGVIMADLRPRLIDVEATSSRP